MQIEEPKMNEMQEKNSLETESVFLRVNQSQSWIRQHEEIELEILY